jgi:hypothetical protein
MKENKLVRFALFILAIFVISLLFTLLDGGLSSSSSFEAGKAVGQTMKHFMRIAGILALIVLMFRLFKESFPKNS